MTDQGPGGAAEYDRMLSQVGWARPDTGRPAPAADDGDQDDDLELTEAEATIAPSLEDAPDPAPAEPEVEPRPVHPHVQVDSVAPLPPAGWYSDPHNPVDYRWWDGSAWTDAVHSVLKDATRYPQSSSARLGRDVRGAIRGLADDLGKH